jgi:small conductance mechanosensitive channel
MRDVELPEWSVVLLEVIRALVRVGLAVAALVIGRWLARTVRRLAVRALDRTDLTKSMNTIFVAAAYYGIWLIAIVASLLFLGVPSAVVLTGVGIVVVILAFSLQQSLRDLAAAVIFMLFKPFRLGDYIETKDISGTVEDIGPFATTIVKWDGKVVVLPNSQIQESGIVNFTTKPTLLTDFNVRIRYGEDVDAARRLIRELIENDARALTTPEARIPVVEEDDSWVVLNVRAGVLLGDYWDLQDSLRERIRVRLDEAGMAAPFPRADVLLAAAGEPPEAPPAAA